MAQEINQNIKNVQKSVFLHGKWVPAIVRKNNTNTATTACDIEQEGNCSQETEQGCTGCTHHNNEDELRIQKGA